MASQGTTSRLSQLQVRFQQKQTQEREMKKSELTRPGGDVVDAMSNNIGTGKVRQMFDQRRQRITGIDKSYPLQPITAKSPNADSTGAIPKRTMTTTKPRTIGYGSTNNGAINQKRVPPISATSTATTVSANRKFVSNGFEETESGGSTKTNPDDVYGSPLENEKFLESPYYNQNESFAKKLPNVGSLPSKNLNGNTRVLKSTAVVKPNTLNVRPAAPRAPPQTTNGKSFAVTSPMRTPEKAMSGRSAMSGASSASSRTHSAIASKVGSASSTPTTPLKPINAGPPPEGMATCSYCSRNFNEDRLQKHEDICKKSKSKKRRVFDAVKARVEGTEAEQYVKKAQKTKKPTAAAAAPEKAKSGNWRKKHEEFIAAIRAAKEVQAHLARGGKLSDLPPPPPSENPDYVQCPHCNRRFNEAAASRHIPKCATMLHNKPKPAAKKR